MANKQRQAGFRFQEETLKRLQKLAEQDRRSKNSLVEILIDREYERVFGKDPLQGKEMKNE